MKKERGEETGTIPRMSVSAERRAQRKGAGDLSPLPCDTVGLSAEIAAEEKKSIDRRSAVR